MADHGAQRMSAGTLQQIGAVAGNVAIKDPEKRNMFNQAYGIGSAVGVMLPFSRSHESEADLIGLDLMARAGFNPEESVTLWQNMAQSGLSPPEFMSTHPSSDTRIQQLRERIPQVQPAYQQAIKNGQRANCKL